MENENPQSNNVPRGYFDDHNHDGVNSQNIDARNIKNLPTGSFAIGNGSRAGVSGSGTESFTGLGFKPKLIRFFSGTNGNGTICDGSSILNNSTITNNDSEVATGGGQLTYNVSTANCITVRVGANVMTAAVTSFDTDGFTLTWVSPGNFFSVVYRWEAFK